MSDKKSSRNILLSVIGIAVLVIVFVGVTFAFFNYTRTGSSNVIKVGRISFISKNEQTINLSNLFPIDPEETGIMNDSTKVGTYTIEIKGDTDNTDGIEYLISAVDANITSNGKTLPISLDITVTTLGTESSSYWTARNSKNATIYKKLVGETLEGNGMLLVGYIKPNTTSGTAEGVDGSITIKAYLDKNKIAISDTYNGEETDNMGTTTNWVNGRVVLTTNEWNALQSTGVSFKVKVEANEGIWVENPSMLYNHIIKDIGAAATIDFANNSSANNGQGMYLLTGTENILYPIYYYRGAINNNNVIFGDYCWQMVRTTDTGGIKMIYNGKPTITGSGNNISYNCGTTRQIQSDIMSTTNLSSSTGYYYADDYEIVSSTGNRATYRLKSSSNSITQVAISSATDASTKIPTIAANYPYTCKKTKENGTCEILYKVDSYESETNANVYASTDIVVIGKSTFNSNYESVSDVGYMSNTRYVYSTTEWIANALFASSATWVTDHYELSDASVTTPDATHHYSCNAVNSESICTDLRYVFNVNGTTKYYITLTNGELKEDALYKMTGNGSPEIEQNNGSYVLNQNSSLIKGVIDTWFETNLTNILDAGKTDYRPYLEDTIYCNDRSFKTMAGLAYYPTFSESGWNKSGGDLTKHLYFGLLNRARNNWYSTTNVPTVVCPNESDRFTVSSSNGNGALTYPVGLLTTDEIVMAGASGDGNSNTSYYLYTGDNYWSLSPYGFVYYYAVEFYVNDRGTLDMSYMVNTHGVRPVISLKHFTEYKSGGDGTSTNPYVVKYD